MPLELDSSCPRGWSFLVLDLPGKSPPACLTASRKNWGAGPGLQLGKKVQHAHEVGHVAVAWERKHINQLSFVQPFSLVCARDIGNITSKFFCKLSSRPRPFSHQKRRAMNAVSSEKHINTS